MLYMTPVNIDPRDPAQTIATPAQYAYDLAEDAGPFYTEEMPEDTKATGAGSGTYYLALGDFAVPEGDPVPPAVGSGARGHGTQIFALCRDWGTSPPEYAAEWTAVLTP